LCAMSETSKTTQPPTSKSTAEDKEKDDNIVSPSSFPQLPANYPFRIVKKLPSQIAQEKRSAAAEASDCSSSDNDEIVVAPESTSIR